MINVNQITSMLAKMPDQALQKYAAMHKNDPYIMALAMSESNRRKETRAGMQAQAAGQEQPKVVDQAVAGMAAQMPEEMGIARLPTGNMNFADGGIVAFARGGTPASDDYTSYILSRAAAMGIDPDMALRLFKTESGLDPAAVSKKGAVGMGQLMPGTAKEMGLSEEDVRDPFKNIDASLGYLSKLQGKYNDPAKALAAYNWGQGNLDKHLAKNDGQLSTVGLPQETAKYLTSILPMGSAQAGQKPAPAGPSLADQIPGVQPQVQYKEPDISFGERAFGAGEAGLSMLSGAISPITGALRSAGQYVVHGKADPVDVSAGEMTYAPRTEGGRAAVAGLAKAADDLKLPPYLPAMGPVVPKGTPKNVGKVLEAADEAAAKAALPRLTGPGATPGSKASAISAMQADQAAAARAAQAVPGAVEAAANVARQNAGLGGLNQAVSRAAPAVSAVGTGAQMAGQQRGQAAADGEVGSVFVPGGESGLRPEDLDAKAKELVKGFAKDTADESGLKGKTKGFSGEDWLTLGLALMAGKSANALENLGAAGLATLKARQERGKQDTETTLKEAQGRYYGAYAGAIERGAKEKNMELEAEKLVQSQMKDWMASTEGKLATLQDPRASAAREAQLRKAIYANLGIQPTMQAGAGALAQLNSSDLALIGKYLR